MCAFIRVHAPARIRVCLCNANTCTARVCVCICVYAPVYDYHIVVSVKTLAPMRLCACLFVCMHLAHAFLTHLQAVCEPNAYSCVCYYVRVCLCVHAMLSMHGVRVRVYLCLGACVCLRVAYSPCLFNTPSSRASPVANTNHEWPSTARPNAPRTDTYSFRYCQGGSQFPGKKKIK